MLEPDAALDRLDHVLDLARKAGADAADCVYFGEASLGCSVRLGRLERLDRSEGEEIGLRLFFGQQSAMVSVSDLGPAALAAAVDRARDMAKAASEDHFAGLAPAERLFSGQGPALDLFDPAVEALTAERLTEMAMATEDAARAFADIRNSEGGSASAGQSRSALATSHGFRGATGGTSVSISAVVVAGEGSGMQRDYDWHHVRHLADLEAPEAVGRRAGERTLARLNPKPAPTGALPVIFDRRVSASLIGHLLGAISGSAIARKTSFLLGREAERVFSSGLTIRDDPHRPRGLRSRAFDGEGLPTAPRALVNDGCLTGWLLDSASARQLGLSPTGHASRGPSGPPGVSAANVALLGGAQSPAELMADIKLGLLVTELIGMGVNGLTGDYSRGAGGFLIRDGQLAEPVAEATIAGNLVSMFSALVAANDLDYRLGINAPTVRIDGMTVAGQ